MRTAPLAILACLAGCVDKAAPAPASHATVRDSAGVQLVTSSAPAWGPHAGWKLASHPTLELGGVAGDPALDFVNVVGAHRLADGGLVVANGSTGELRWFGADGKSVRIVGGRGSGGGQFVLLSSLFTEGDTLLAWDARLRRLTRFSPHGDLLRVDTLRLADTTRQFGVLGVMNDGSVVVEAAAPLDLTQKSAGIIRPLKGLFRLLPGAPPESLGVVAGDELFLSIKDGNATLSGLPFGLRARVLVLPRGYLLSDGRAVEIDHRDASGRLLQILRWSGGRVPVTGDDSLRQLRDVVGGARSGIQRAKVESLWRALPVPDSFPAIVGLAADEAALAWVRRGGHLGDSAEAWSVLDTAGAWLGTMVLPGGAAPLEISRDWVVLRVIDADRIERVQLRRLER
jgi:hypothetical protein